MNVISGHSLWPSWKSKLLRSTVIRHLVMKKYFSKSQTTLYAQPTAKTHAHLLKADEVTPGLTADNYSSRRIKLIEKIHQKNLSTSKNDVAHLIVIPSNSVTYMSENIPYPFRQNSDFLYLSGYKESNSLLVLYTSVGKSYFETVLFIPKPSAHSERWEGSKMDLDSVTSFFGINKALYIDDFEKFLQFFAKANKRFFLWYDYLKSPFRVVHQTMRSFMEAYNQKMTVESPQSLLHELRLLKSDSEAQLMRKTCQVAADAMAEVIKFSKPMILESQLQAKMDYECRIRGAENLAFPPVVAGGDRANTIHYIDNNQVIEDNDMVLMDAGCEYNGYCSDLARTWPVNGRFTDPQKELYEAVLEVQEELIEMCRGKPSLDYLFKVMCHKLGTKFQELGLISKTASKEEILQAAYDFCPHHVSHYLGMDVHDTNLISRGLKLQPGMVVTVEPGIYVAKNNAKVPEKYRGICIRIEDDIFITNDGYEVLTSSCPKHINDIEQLFSIR